MKSVLLAITGIITLLTLQTDLEGLYTISNKEGEATIKILDNNTFQYRKKGTNKQVVVRTSGEWYRKGNKLYLEETVVASKLAVQLNENQSNSLGSKEQVTVQLLDEARMPMQNIMISYKHTTSQKTKNIKTNKEGVAYFNKDQIGFNEAGKVIITFSVNRNNKIQTYEVFPKQKNDSNIITMLKTIDQEEVKHTHSFTIKENELKMIKSNWGKRGATFEK